MSVLLVMVQVVSNPPMDLSSTKSVLFLHTQPWLSPITRLLLVHPSTPWSSPLWLDYTLHTTQSPGIVTPFLCTPAMAVSSAIVCYLSAHPIIQSFILPNICLHTLFMTITFISLTSACIPHLWLSPATIWPLSPHPAMTLTSYSKTNDHTQLMVLLPTVKTLPYITLMSQSPAIV